MYLVSQMLLEDGLRGFVRVEVIGCDWMRGSGDDGGCVVVCCCVAVNNCRVMMMVLPKMLCECCVNKMMCTTCSENNPQCVTNSVCGTTSTRQPPKSTQHTSQSTPLLDASQVGALLCICCVVVHKDP